MNVLIIGGGGIGQALLSSALAEALGYQLLEHQAAVGRPPGVKWGSSAAAGRHLLTPTPRGHEICGYRPQGRRSSPQRASTAASAATRKRVSSVCSVRVTPHTADPRDTCSR